METERKKQLNYQLQQQQQQQQQYEVVMRPNAISFSLR